MKIFVVANFIKSYTVADPDLQIRDKGGGGGNGQPEPQGPGHQKNFFRPFGSHFGLNKKRGPTPLPPTPGAIPWIRNCYNAV